MLANGKRTYTTCKQDKLLVINYVKFHLTILYTVNPYNSNMIIVTIAC